MIEKVVEASLRSKVDEVKVVIGFEGGLIRQALAGKPCEFLLNEEYEKGQSTSVKIGVHSVSSYAEAAVILPADVALVTSRIIDKVVDEYRKSKSDIVIASYQGRLGHPALFDRSLFDEILRISEESEGLKTVMRKHRDLIELAETGDVAVLIDIDTRDDFDKYLAV